jgi:hypothetical protein
MANLLRRLKKLDAVMLDDVGLVTGSPRWWAYWMEQLYKYLDRDPDARNTKVPLEVLRAYMRDADPDGIERLPPPMLRKRCHELSLEYQRKHTTSRA